MKNLQEEKITFKNFLIRTKIEYFLTKKKSIKLKIFMFYFFSFINLFIGLLTLYCAYLMLYDTYSKEIENFFMMSGEIKNFLIFTLEAFLLALFIVIGLLITIAFYTLVERKVMAAMHRRR